MKKIFVISTVIACILASSCSKKTDFVTQASLELEVLSTKYHLKKCDGCKVNSGLNFNDVKSFRDFLEKRFPDDPTTSSSTSLGQNDKDSDAGTIVVRTVDDAATEGTNAVETLQSSYINGATRSAILNFPVLASKAFPSKVLVQWSYYLVAFNLMKPGANFGTWAYDHSSSNFSATTIDESGIYSETYSVNGVFTYTRYWQCNFNAVYSPALISATLAYTYIQ